MLATVARRRREMSYSNVCFPKRSNIVHIRGYFAVRCLRYLRERVRTLSDAWPPQISIRLKCHLLHAGNNEHMVRKTSNRCYYRVHGVPRDRALNNNIFDLIHQTYSRQAISVRGALSQCCCSDDRVKSVLLRGSALAGRQQQCMPWIVLASGVQRGCLRVGRTLFLSTSSVQGNRLFVMPRKGIHRSSGMSFATPVTSRLACRSATESDSGYNDLQHGLSEVLPLVTLCRNAAGHVCGLARWCQTKARCSCDFLLHGRSASLAR